MLFRDLSFVPGFELSYELRRLLFLGVYCPPSSTHRFETHTLRSKYLTSSSMASLVEKLTAEGGGESAGTDHTYSFLNNG